MEYFARVLNIKDDKEENINVVDLGCKRMSVLRELNQGALTKESVREYNKIFVELYGAETLHGCEKCSEMKAECA